jgi:class 3 adenylate cyclase
MTSPGADPAGAIVFTDIVGFTELTDLQGDDVALAVVERQVELVRQVLPPRARIVKELGDGLRRARAARTVRVRVGRRHAALDPHRHALGSAAPPRR